MHFYSSVFLFSGKKEIILVNEIKKLACYDANILVQRN